MRSANCLIFMISLLLGAGQSAYSQIACFTPKMTALENSELELALQKSTKNLRRSNYQIAINAVVLQSDNSTFSQYNVEQLIANANLYFKEIGLQFYLQNNEINEIRNSNFYNFDIKEESILRNLYDRNDAVNIYFVKNITLEDGSKLNGYSSLPTLGNHSNRLMFSYLDNNIEDFKTLKNKTFLHELGHYFGLLHTFQDSNSEDLTKRELVTRNQGANCISTGDQLCDTPSDPFERDYSLLSANCTASFPIELADLNGSTFQPLFDNIMSYYLRCGNEFTIQQYQRMEASLSIRLSPSAHYEIAAKDNQFLAIKSFEKKVYCAGEFMQIETALNGTFNDGNVFSLEITDEKGMNFYPFLTINSGENAQIQIPENIPEGNNYRLRISSSSPYITGVPSQNFEIQKPGKIKLSVPNPYINLGDYGEIQVHFTGTGPWDFRLSDGTEYANIYKNQVNIFVQPSEDLDFQISKANQKCGVQIDSSTVQLKVVQPAIKILNELPNNLCKEEIIQLSTKGLDFNNISIYRILIEGLNESFLVKPSISAFSMNFQLPNEISIDKDYKLKVAGFGLGDFSHSISFKVQNKPEKPKVESSSISYCLNADAKPIIAIGTDLKWYHDQFDGNHTGQIIPNTKTPGIRSYFVSQVSEHGCESRKSKIDIEVYESVSAEITGSNQIISGDSVKLNISLTGESPWLVKLNDGSIIKTENANMSFSVKPTESTSYSIKEVSNACGIGFTYGEANIDVLMILSNEALEKSNELKIYPNPASSYLFIETANPNSEQVEIYIYNHMGQLFWKESRKNEIGKIRINLPVLRNGNYIFSIINGDDISYRKIHIMH